MTFTLHGFPVSRGIAVGTAHVVERGEIEVPERRLRAPEIEPEVERLHEALAVARSELAAIRDRMPPGTATDVAAFIDAHLLMLDDAALTREPERLVRDLACNAEWAVRLQRDALVRVFDEMQDPYLRTRRDDVDHVVRRVLRILLAGADAPRVALDAPHGAIVIADELSPADTVLLQHQGIGAFVTESGGPTSHTAILARSLGIPAVVGVQEALRWLRGGENIIVDGTRGLLLVEPDATVLAWYREAIGAEARRALELSALRETRAQTADGEPVALLANIELPRDVDAVLRAGAGGVGLYRTEFLFMNRPAPPSEEEQYAAYCAVLRALDGLPVTIRTLDLGADKEVDGGRRSGPAEANPALGLRAVRLTLREPALFRPQLRAILRASAHGPVRLMVPMLSTLDEVAQVRALLDEVRAELDAEGRPYDADLPVGGMIEVPAAAVCADLFADALDFLSIGTNDLIQYTIAIDRVNEAVNHLYDPLHPAVLRLIHGVIEAGARAGIPVSMCGEMAGEPRYVPLLLALGLREFSVHPAMVPEVKRSLRACSARGAALLAPRLLAARDGVEIDALLTQAVGSEREVMAVS